MKGFEALDDSIPENINGGINDFKNSDWQQAMYDILSDIYRKVESEIISFTHNSADSKSAMIYDTDSTENPKVDLTILNKIRIGVNEVRRCLDMGLGLVSAKNRCDYCLLPALDEAATTDPGYTNFVTSVRSLL